MKFKEIACDYQSNSMFSLVCRIAVHKVVTEDISHNLSTDGGKRSLLMVQKSRQVPINIRLYGKRQFQKSGKATSKTGGFNS